MPEGISKTKIEVNANSLHVPIYVIRSGKSGFTITCADRSMDSRSEPRRHNFKSSETSWKLCLLSWWKTGDIPR